MGGWTLDLAVVSLEHKGERNTERRERASTALGPVALVFPVAGVSAGQGATSAAAWCMREMCREKKGMVRVTGVGYQRWVFCSCEERDQPSDSDHRRSTAPGSQRKHGPVSAQAGAAREPLRRPARGLLGLEPKRECGRRPRASFHIWAKRTANEQW
jgi:hypothetical protein